MAPEDDRVLKIICENGADFNIGMTYGGDEIDQFRFDVQWGIKHLPVSSSYGGGRTARLAAHEDFVRTMVGEPLTGDQRAEPVVVVIGQSSVNFVSRVPREPIREFSYDVEQRYEDGPKEVRQVGGQGLVPAAFLNKWGVGVCFASLIGFDEYGLEIRKFLETLDNVNWSSVVQHRDIRSERSYVTTFENARTVVDAGGVKVTKVPLAPISDQVPAEPFTTDIPPSLFSEKMLENIGDIMRSGMIQPKVFYLSRWYLTIYGDKINEWLQVAENGSGMRPLVVYETGNFGGKTEDFENHQALVGPHCDIILSSALFAMRAALVPLYSPMAKDVLFFPTEPQHPDRRIWEARLLRYVAKTESVRAYQYDALGYALEYLGLESFRAAVFGGRSKFSRAKWWVITLGEAGIMALSKEASSSALWVSVPPDERMENTWGCGDVARAAFVASIYKEPPSNLDDVVRIELAVKRAAAAGNLKGRYFELNKALEKTTWSEVDKGQGLDTYDLTKTKNFQRLVTRLK